MGHVRFGPVCRSCYNRLLRNERKGRPARHYSRRGAQCSVPGCGGPDYTRGFCSTHYNRAWRYGDPHLVMSWDADGEIEDDYTRNMLLRAHAGVTGCEAPLFKPRRVWRSMGFDPIAGEISLTPGAKHAFKVFCVHQVRQRWQQ